MVFPIRIKRNTLGFFGLKRSNRLTGQLVFVPSVTLSEGERQQNHGSDSNHTAGY
jgi:hypothetical protein